MKELTHKEREFIRYLIAIWQVWLETNKILPRLEQQEMANKLMKEVGNVSSHNEEKE